MTKICQDIFKILRAFTLCTLTPRNHKDILKKVSARARATARETAVKAVRKELRSSNISCVVLLHLQRTCKIKDSVIHYMTYKVSKKYLIFV